MKPAVVVPVDPAGGGVFNVGDGLERAGVEHAGADALGLIQTIDRLHEGVVIRVADRPDRWLDLLEFEMLGETNRGVLTRHRNVE